MAVHDDVFVRPGEPELDRKSTTSELFILMQPLTHVFVEDTVDDFEHRSRCDIWRLIDDGGNDALQHHHD